MTIGRFAGAINYLFSEITLEGSASVADLGIDPIQIEAGAYYRF